VAAAGVLEALAVIEVSEVPETTLTISGPPGTIVNCPDSARIPEDEIFPTLLNTI
jgi:hypothetical protein